MINPGLRWTSLPLALATAPGPPFDTVLVPVLFDILTFVLFTLGVAAFFWGRSKREGTLGGRRIGMGGGGRRGMNILTGVTAILPVAWLFLIWTSISTTSIPSQPIKATVSPTQNKVSPMPTPDFVTSGALTIGSSFNVLSQTSADQGKPEGFDIDLATNIAQGMGLTPDFVNTPDGISSDQLIKNLLNKKYDIVISALKMNGALNQQVDFVPYLNVGESLLVARDNSKPPLLTRDVTDLCEPAPGPSIGVRENTTALTDLQIGLAKCKAGKTFQIMPEKSTSDAIGALLVDHKVNAVFEDSTITDYYINKGDPDRQLSLGGQVINEMKEGIAVRKRDAGMLQAIQRAYGQLKKNTTYDKLITKWGFVGNEPLM